MATWTVLPDAGFDVGKPITQAQGLGLKDNPEAMAERATNAPIVQVPFKEYKLTGTATTWNIPAGVTAFEVHVTGGGGSGDNVASGGDGGTSNFVYDGVTVQATGGISGYGTGAGGTASGANLAIAGGSGATVAGSSNATGQGGSSYYGGPGAYGSGGEGNAAGDIGGGAGATAIRRFVVDPVAAAPTFTVGAGGASASSGLVVIIY
mgnify:CR=1 FL=1